MSQAEELNLSVQLQVFRINPAERLYERLGFQRVGETEHHIQMRWAPTEFC